MQIRMRSKIRGLYFLSENHISKYGKHKKCKNYTCFLLFQQNTLKIILCIEEGMAASTVYVYDRDGISSRMYIFFVSPFFHHLLRERH